MVVVFNFFIDSIAPVVDEQCEACRGCPSTDCADVTGARNKSILNLPIMSRETIDGLKETFKTYDMVFMKGKYDYHGKLNDIALSSRFNYLSQFNELCVKDPKDITLLYVIDLNPVRPFTHLKLQNEPRSFRALGRCLIDCKSNKMYTDIIEIN